MQPVTVSNVGEPQHEEWKQTPVKCSLLPAHPLNGWKEKTNAAGKTVIVKITLNRD